MSLERLRALALEHNPTTEYFVCLDPAKRLELVGLRQLWLRTKQERDDYRPEHDDGDLASEATPDRLDRELSELEEQIAAAEDDAREDSIALVFRRLPASADSADEDEMDFESLVRAYTGERGNVDVGAVSRRLPELCYLRAESSEGDLGLTWREAAKTLDAADLRTLRAQLWGHHNIGAAVPFDPRTSGQPETT